jgi:hypothetical protein
MWVINWVHRNTANCWAFTQPTLTASFTQLDILIIGVGYGADSRHALATNQT